MNLRGVHLNLLQESERRTSSPVRPKVILPILFGVLLAGTVIWWVSLMLNEHLTESEMRSLRADIAAKEKQYAEICALKADLKAKEAELGQLRGYRRGCLKWGRTLTALAQAVPETVQLSKIEISDPPPQNLLPPPGIKRPPLLGPTNAEERVVFRIAGRTALEKNLFALLKATKSRADFNTNLVTSGETPNPRIRQFRQDATADSDGQRAIVFDLEYATKGRNFAP